MDPVVEADLVGSVVSLSAFTPYLDGPDEDDMLVAGLHVHSTC